MLITSFRPSSHPVKTAPAKEHVAAAPPDGFAAASHSRLSEVDAMAALAQAAKIMASPKADLPQDLAAAVRGDLGDSGVISLQDDRVQSLHGHLVQGWEAPSFDPLTTLGDGWEQQERDATTVAAPYVFSRHGFDVVQHIALDPTSGATSLTTIHAQTFISTRHYEMVRDRDGNVVVSDTTVH